MTGMLFSRQIRFWRCFWWILLHLKTHSPLLKNRYRFCVGSQNAIKSAITVIKEGTQNPIATRCFFKASLGALLYLLLGCCFSSSPLVMLCAWISHHWVQGTAQSIWIQTPLISSASPLHWSTDLVAEDHISLGFEEESNGIFLLQLASSC